LYKQVRYYLHFVFFEAAPRERRASIYSEEQRKKERRRERRKSIPFSHRQVFPTSEIKE
jgi:hypothetical protein